MLKITIVNKTNKPAAEFLAEKHTEAIPTLSTHIFADRVEIVLSNDDCEDLTDLAEAAGYVCEIEEEKDDQLFWTPRCSSKDSYLRTPRMRS